MTESFNQSLEDWKILEDFNVVKKRVDNIQNTLASRKNLDMGQDSGISKNTMFDYSKYLEVSSFHEFQRNQTKEVESIRTRVEETKRMIDDLIAEMRMVVKDKDLKNLEGNVVL